MRFQNLIDWEFCVSDLRERYVEAGHDETEFVKHLGAVPVHGPVPPRDPYWRAKHLGKPAGP